MYINAKQIKDQVRKHYKHISKCDDHCNQTNTIIQSEPGNCSCPDYSERITEIENRLTEIERILENFSEPPPSQSTGTEETVLLSLSPPTAGPIRSTASPNTVAFDSLLAKVEDMKSDEMNEFYEQFISPVIAQNGYNLLSPIPVSALCSCTRIPSVETPGGRITWEDLNNDAYIENKRSYIMQFILANRSNSTRALYLTNQLIGAFTLPL